MGNLYFCPPETPQLSLLCPIYVPWVNEWQRSGMACVLKKWIIAISSELCCLCQALCTVPHSESNYCLATVEEVEAWCNAMVVAPVPNTQGPCTLTPAMQGASQVLTSGSLYIASTHQELWFRKAVGTLHPCHWYCLNVGTIAIGWLSARSQGPHLE
jgi:hypothetical protein